MVEVVDRGMLRPKRLDELSCKSGIVCKSITALTHRQVCQLLERKVVQLELFDERTHVDVADPDAEQQRILQLLGVKARNRSVARVMKA